MAGKFLKIGTNVLIERRDGRVHSAIVSQINYDLGIVDVEWIENNETKGKELDFQTLTKLNPYMQIGKTAKFNIPTSSRHSELQPPTSRSSFKQRSAPPPPAPHTTRSMIGRIERERNQRRFKQAQLKTDRLEITKKIMNYPYYEWEQMIYEYWKNLKRRPLRHNDTIDNDRVITVCVRKRPLNKMELSKKEIDVITVLTKDQLIIHEPKTKIDLTKSINHQLFKFDLVFDENCTNETIYKFTAKPLITTIFNGGNATCFAYGQTGSGKTYTIFGDNHNKNGIYTLIIDDIFKSLNSNEYKQLNLKISCSFFELYSRKILDLFNKKQELKIFEDNRQQIQIVGLTEKSISRIDDLLQLIQIGNNLRTSGTTKINKNSSRSHAIFQIYLKRFINNQLLLHGRFSLIDLAGNERGSNTFNTTKSTTRLAHMESGEINKSLLALKECIRALKHKDAKHLPFRLSKLTQILRDSFIGDNSKTCMIATIAPNICSCEDTMNTLRYADRVKELSNTDSHSCSDSDQQSIIIEDENNDDNDNDNDNNDNSTILKGKHEEIINKLIDTVDSMKSLHTMIDKDKNIYCGHFQSLINDTVKFLLNSKDHFANLVTK